MASTISDGSACISSGRSGRGGSVYARPGSSCRMSLSSKSTRLSASMIRPFCTSTMLEYRPISSAAMVFTTLSPISLTHAKSKNTMRSPSITRISSRRPPVKCLRSSMQNEGGVWGFSNASCVRQTRAEPDRAERNRRAAPERMRRLSTTSSRVGSKILSMRASPSVCFSSRAVNASVAASSAIGYSFAM